MANPNVLFLCTGNSCRSQIAESLLRQRAADRFNVYSAGTAPKPIHPLTIQVLEECGIDTSTLRSKDTSEFFGRLMPHHLIIVCASAESHCPRIFPGMVHRQFWPFEDPLAFQGREEKQLAKFREVRDQIDERIQQWLKTLTTSTET
jgi:arsenate reductase